MIGDGVQEVFLVAHATVKRNRGDAEARGHAPHAHGVETLFEEDLGRHPDDVIDVELKPRGLGHRSANSRVGGGGRGHGKAHASGSGRLPKSRAISSGNSARAEPSRSMLGGIRLNPPQTLRSWPVTHSD